MNYNWRRSYDLYNSHTRHLIFKGVLTSSSAIHYWVYLYIKQLAIKIGPDKIIQAQCEANTHDYQDFSVFCPMRLSIYPESKTYQRIVPSLDVFVILLQSIYLSIHLDTNTVHTARRSNCSLSLCIVLYVSKMRRISCTYELYKKFLSLFFMTVLLLKIQYVI